MFALRCHASSSSGACVGHGSDGHHPDGGLCLSLEEQVCVLSVAQRQIQPLFIFIPPDSMFSLTKEKEFRRDI